MKYYIGIDGGGTKTAFRLADEDFRPLAVRKKGSASYKQIGRDGVIRLLTDNLQELCVQGGIGPEDEIYTCFGMPMFGEYKKFDEEIQKNIKKHLSRYHIKVVNDVEVGWAGSLGMEPGINIVSGTGSIAFGKNEEGRSAKAGGWSEFFSDAGSCNWLGRRTMELFSKQADLCIPRGPLYDIVRGHFHLKEDMEVIEIVEEEHVPYRDKVASLQLLLKEAASQGDTSALQLYDEAAYELYLLVAGVYRQLQMAGNCKISCSGGAFLAGEVLLNPFIKYVSELPVDFVRPRYTPVEGAVLLARYYENNRR